MTLIKENFEAVLTASQTVADKVALLVDSITLAAPTDFQFNATFVDIYNKLVTIEDWASDKIIEAEQEQVMNGFLAEMKVVFEKYSASATITPFEDGYGVGYGEPGLGYVLTASFEGVTSSKDIKKSVIDGSDLV